MGFWDDIPDPLVPDPKELATLIDIIDDAREAMKVRHDFQTSAAVASGERRLHPSVSVAPPSSTPRTLFESDFDLAFFGNNGGKHAGLADFAKEHQRLHEHAKALIGKLTTDGLKSFLTRRIKLLFTDIGLDSGGKALRRLPGRITLLNTLLMGRPDILVRLLLVHPFLRARPVKHDPLIDKKLVAMLQDVTDNTGAWYW